MSKAWGFIKCPLYNYIHISRFEKDLIDTYPFQRLRRLRQLVGAEYVYPGACHTRLEHSLGVMHLAGELSTNLEKSGQLKKTEVQEIKISALLHDIGHGPFSHVFEPLLIQDLKKTHEDMSTWIIRKTEVADIMNNEGVDPARVSELAVGRLKDAKKFMNQIISSAVDVDKMDFVGRDTYHTGAEYGHVDIFRLIYTMDTLDDCIAVDLTALTTLETFILARIESFRAIYFHRVSRAAQIMLEKALYYARDELGITKFDSVDDYLKLDDYTMWTYLKQAKESGKIIDRLERRDLLKQAYEKTFLAKDEMLTSVLTNEKIRSELENQLSKTANLPPEQVIIDVPSLPSVATSHAMSPEHMEIPMFYKDHNGRKNPRRLSDASKIIDLLRGYMNIVRVYTTRENREAVSRASEKLLGRPQSLEISY
ncbi:MAG: HD domain-containing protein [Promethearchaeati archaeon SRVP18_Atabeyarchaeia-1]